MNAAELRRSLRASLKWIHQSGIMLPRDGSWGVAERIVLTVGNQSLAEIHAGFPAYSEHEGYEVIESRRTDCNFQMAFLFLLAAEILRAPRYAAEAERILHFLYCRSGLLLRTVPGKGTQCDCRYAPGTWNWSHTSWRPLAFFDDDSWACLLQLVIGERYPELDRKFGCREWGLRLAFILAEQFPHYLSGDWTEATLPASGVWYGDPHSPHWGGMVCLALGRAQRSRSAARFPEIVSAYFRELLSRPESYTTSECAYALLAALEWTRIRPDGLYRETAQCFAKRLRDAMDENGNVRSEHGEAPQGSHLADTIYTLNWAILGLQGMACVDPDYVLPYEKLLTLLLRIQDRTMEKHLFGCWRGMFNLQTGSWGGGNAFEGGADSIYSGWTNAPIAWSVAFALQKTALFAY